VQQYFRNTFNPGRNLLGGTGSNRKEKFSQATSANFPPKRYFMGIMAGLIAAVGQSFGMLLAKIGLMITSHTFSKCDPMMTAFLAFWASYDYSSQVISKFQQATYQKSGLLYILGGSFFGPLIGVTYPCLLYKYDWE